jgi:hypothetical protein
MVSGVAVGQTAGELPATTAQTAQLCVNVAPQDRLPGTVSTRDTHNTGVGMIGEAPATGVQTGQQGSVCPDGCLPGTAADVAV